LKNRKGRERERNESAGMKVPFAMCNNQSHQFQKGVNMGRGENNIRAHKVKGKRPMFELLNKKVWSGLNEQDL
jgi:hypothetical protein